MDIVTIEIRNYETRKGTAYTVERWLCPICNKEKSTLYIDGEWCHGDSRASHHHNGQNDYGCADCILQPPAKLAGN